MSRVGGSRVLAPLEQQLGRITMYRLVTLTLAALVAVYVVFTATGVIEGLSTTDNLIALAVVVVASLVANRLFGLVWRLHPHDESALITALLLFFLFVPLPDASAANLAWLAGAASLANASKYVLAWRGRHVFNPAAAGALLVVVAQDLAGRDAPINALWQTAATESLLPFLAVGALVVLWRTGRLEVGLLFTALALAGIVLGLAFGADMPAGDAWRTAVTSYPVIFLAGFMVSEPLTLPPRRWQQFVVAVVMAVLVSGPMLALLADVTLPTIGPVSLTPEVALLLGNLLAFALGRRTRVSLTTTGVRNVAGDTWEIAFRPRRAMRFAPGQHLELHLPHDRVDRRGVRRVFTISSAPHDADLTVAVRVPERSSSFKQALVALREGDRVRSTGVQGDFVWPRGGAPLVLVAGGIGITPFLSQLRAREARDVVLVYAVPDGSAVAYREELEAAGVRVVLVSPERPDDLPAGWEHAASELLTGDIVVSAVPDLGDRVALVSGPPAMVRSIASSLGRRCRGVRTDAFAGY